MTEELCAKSVTSAQEELTLSVMEAGEASKRPIYGQGLRFAQGIIENVEKQFNLNEVQS
jgi:hypothetical protein